MKIHLITYFLTICTLSTVATKNLYFYNNLNSRNMQVSHIVSDDNDFLPGYRPDTDSDVRIPKLNSSTHMSNLDADEAGSNLNSEHHTSKLFVYKNTPRKVAEIENDGFTTKSISIIENNPQLFLKDMFEILTKDLKNADIVKEIISNHNVFRKKMPWYVINPKPPFKYKYIKIPISVISYSNLISSRPNKNNDNIFLIFDTNNFHLQGYQKLRLNISPTYYHFANATITSIKENQKFLKSIKLPIKTSYEKKSYDNDVLTWKKIYASFNKLLEMSMASLTENINETEVQNIMLVTLEALKFRDFQKLLDYNAGSTILTSNILNDWKNFFFDRINVWGKSSEITRMIKNLEERGNINSLVLSDYAEFILPWHINKYLYKNSLTNNYELKLCQKTLYYDPITKANKVVSFTFKLGGDKNNFAIYDINLKKVNPLDFNYFNFIGDTGSRTYIPDPHQDIKPNNNNGLQLKWGSTIYNNYITIDEFNLLYRDVPKSFVTEDDQIHRINMLLESKIYKGHNHGFIHKKITTDSTWQEIDFVTPITLQKIDDKTSNFLTIIPALGSGFKGNMVELSAEQKVGLTWYYDDEKDEYHLQLIIHCNAKTLYSFADVTSTIKIGNGIRLLYKS